MAQAFDSTLLFNDDVFSDITIKFSNHEIKCHRIVLCTASEYFRALCSPASKFSERDSAVIKLLDDDAIAIETVLRYIYNFKYSDIEASLGPFTAHSHMSVVVAARKYLLTKLEGEALTCLEKAIAAVEVDCARTGDATGLLDMIELLLSHKDHNSKFEIRAKTLTQHYMPKLFALPRFRASLDTAEGKQALELASEAVASGTTVLRARG